MPYYYDPIGGVEQDDDLYSFDTPPGGGWSSFIGSVVDDMAASKRAFGLQAGNVMERTAARATTAPGDLAEFGSNYIGWLRKKGMSDPFGIAEKVDPFLRRTQTALDEVPFKTTEEALAYPIQTKAAREVERSRLLGSDPSFGRKAGVLGAEIGTEILATAPESLLAGGAIGAFSKSLPWIRRVAQTRPKTAGAIAGGIGAGVEGMGEEAWLSEGLPGGTRAGRMAMGALGGGALGSVGGAVGAHLGRNQQAAAVGAFEKEMAEKLKAIVDDQLGPGYGIDPELDRVLAKESQQRIGRIARTNTETLIRQERTKFELEDYLTKEKEGVDFVDSFEGDTPDARMAQAQESMERQIYDAYGDEKLIDELPERLREPVRLVRETQDDLSEQVADLVDKSAGIQVGKIADRDVGNKEVAALREGAERGLDPEFSRFSPGKRAALVAETRLRVDEEVRKIAAVTDDNFSDTIREIMVKREMKGKAPTQTEYSRLQRRMFALEGKLSEMKGQDDLLDELLALDPFSGYSRAVKSRRLVNKIRDQKGSYMYRSYAKHQDPTWAKQQVERMNAIRKTAGGDLSEEQVELAVAWDRASQILEDRLFKTSSNADRLELFRPRTQNLAAGADVEKGGQLTWLGENGRYDLTPEARQQVEASLYTMMDHSNPGVGLTNLGKVPKAEFGSLKKRRDLDESIRVLMGEVIDPFRRMEKSIGSIVADLETHSFLGKFREGLEQSGKVSRAYDAESGFIHEVSAGRGAGLLQEWTDTPKLYTDDEVIAGILNNAPSKVRGNLLNQMNAVTHVMKTMGSVQTHVRNFLGNMAFVAATGHNPFAGLTPKGGGVARKMSALEGRQTITKKSGKEMVMQFDMPEFDEFHRRYLDLVERGIAETVAVGDLKRYYDGIARDGMTTIGKGVKKLVDNKATKAVTEAYHLEDYFWKAYTYDKELNRLLDFLPEPQARKYALDVMEDALPIYGRVPKIVQNIRDMWLIGPFVSFPSELIRTAVHTTKRTIAEVRTPEKVLQGMGIAPDKMTKEMVDGIRKVGMKRFYGMASMSMLPGATAATGAMISGMTPDQDAAARSFIAPWAENSSLTWFSNNEETGDKSYFDMSYLVPHSMFVAPFRTLQRTLSDPNLGAIDWGLMTGKEFFDQFVAPEITISEFTNAVRDWEDVSALGPEAKAGVILNRAWRAFAPGTAVSMERLVRGTGWFEDQLPSHNRFGRQYKWKGELASMLGVPRVTTFNAQEGLRWKGREFGRAFRQARGVESKEMFSSPNRRVDAQRQAYQDYDTAAREMLTYVTNARTLKLTEVQIATTLKDAGMTKAEVQSLMAGTVPEYRSRLD